MSSNRREVYAIYLPKKERRARKIAQDKESCERFYFFLAPILLLLSDELMIKECVAERLYESGKGHGI